MDEITVVIGAAFGDEGKGLMVDYLVRQGSPSNTTVVRFNGGAQAGHTVVTPNGKRHVFSHFGAGTLAGAGTYLGPEFIVNPILWRKEEDALLGLTLLSEPLVSSNAWVTTPWDMLINQATERARGNFRHGSCGVGIHETIERSRYAPLRFDSLPTKDRLIEMQTHYFKHRVEDLGLNDTLTLEEEGILRSPEAAEKFLAEWASVLATQQDRSQEFGEHVIMEGAQGLLLDAEHQFFPYVTRSRTGLTNVLKFIAAGFFTPKVINVVYVLRSYMTRHGVGPFPTADEDMSFEDNTNNTNEWQGPLRFGRLDTALIQEAINIDLHAARGVLAVFNPTIEVRPVLALTHLDQHDVDEFKLAYKLNIPLGYVVNGPTAAHVTKV